MGEHYIYALIIFSTQEPFYIGCGTGNRMWDHRQASSQKLDYAVHRQIAKLWLEQDDYYPMKIRTHLPKDLAYKVEHDLIRLIGTMDTGTGPLANQLYHSGNSVTCWGVEFPCIQALANDSRCEVSKDILRRRLQEGKTPEVAIKNTSSIICWGEEFSSTQALVDDPRCVVTAGAFKQRLQAGATPEEAATWSHRGKECICWGERFPSILAITDDSRCVVSKSTFRKRVYQLSWPVEKAASIPVDSRYHHKPY